MPRIVDDVVDVVRLLGPNRYRGIVDDGGLDPRVIGDVRVAEEIQRELHVVGGGGDPVLPAHIGTEVVGPLLEVGGMLPASGESPLELPLLVPRREGEEGEKVEVPGVRLHELDAGNRHNDRGTPGVGRILGAAAGGGAEEEKEEKWERGLERNGLQQAF